MSIVGSEQWMYASGGFYNYPIEQSLRFEDGDSAYLSRTPASAGNRKTWTWSGWVKRANLTRGVLFSSHFGNNARYTYWEFDASHRFNLFIANDNGANPATFTQLITSAVFRDTSAWYHIVVSVDTTQATASDRASIYVNGEEVTAFSTENYPAQNINTFINNTYEHHIGIFDTTTTTINFDGYMADVNFIDGTALDASSFGETKSGIWIPKDTSGLTFGTNGFRLEFGDSSAIGDDTSGNTNDWAANNLVASDVVLDNPTNNFATLNPLNKLSQVTLSEGNLAITFSGTSGHSTTGTFAPPSGKWYMETRAGGSGVSIGFGNSEYNLTWAGNDANSFGYRGDLGQIMHNGSAQTSGLSTFTSGDIIGCAIDIDNEKIWWAKNGTWLNSGDPAAGTGALVTSWSGIDWTFAIGQIAGSYGTSVFNAGADSTFAGNETAGGNADENGIGDFAYAPPSGFLSLCSANLPTGAIDTLADETPEDYFNTVLWSGNGSTQSISVGFQPDLVWIRRRNIATNHNIFDSIRGANVKLYPNLTDAEFTDTDALTSFDSDGFSLGADAEAGGASGSTYVGWSWKANGSGVSNTDGSITSTVSVGATSQQNWFSIISYTGNGSAGATVGHGLGRKPDILFYKNRDDGTQNWVVYTDITGTNGFLILNSEAAFADASAVVSAPNSSTFNLHSFTSNNGSGDGIICYAFANAEGLCKVGSYVGNGSSDGVFVACGFKPSLVLLKRTDGAENWLIYDNKRDPHNVTDEALLPNSSSASGGSANAMDLLSNGFKFRSSAGSLNASGGDYIYLAIAEQPFAFANAR